MSVGQGVVKTFTLKNPALKGPPITFGIPLATTSDPLDFRIGTTTCHAQLFPQTKCTLKVKFAPTTPGPKSSTLTIFDNAANANQQIPLKGTGQ